MLSLTILGLSIILQFCAAAAAIRLIFLTKKIPAWLFIAGAMVPGNTNITAEHDGATYYFARQINRETFLTNPEHYVPAFGGYCAFGASKGKLFPVEIDTWQIKDDRLILNYNAEIKTQFDANIEALLETADANWPGIQQNEQS